MSISRRDDFYEDENCGHCVHHRTVDGEWVCHNPESECYGCYTEYNETCDCFEERMPNSRFSMEITGRKKF